jgi:CO/xanthine dehydrogenase FAD-binding subunit
MIPTYIPAQSIEEALEHLCFHGEKTRILAGGTDVMVVLRTARLEGRTAPEFILDVSAISEMKKMYYDENQVNIGAVVSFRELESLPVIQEKMPLLSTAASRIGSLQVRHLATLGGNVGSSSPAGDGITPLVALSAMAHIRSSKGARTLPVTDLITGPGKNALACNELIISFSINCPSQPQNCFFDKVMRRQVVAISRMNVAVQLALDASRRISSARIAAGAVLPRPRRLDEVEKLLVDQIPSEALFIEAGETATQVMLAMSGKRPSMAYKVPALKKLVARSLRLACRTEWCF